MHRDGGCFENLSLIKSAYSSEKYKKARNRLCRIYSTKIYVSADIMIDRSIIKPPIAIFICDFWLFKGVMNKIEI
jgi:hypothetical protein